MASKYKRLVLLILASIFILSPAVAAPIHDSAEAGDIEQVKQLIAKGAKVDDARDKDGATPLHVAAQEGKPLWSSC